MDCVGALGTGLLQCSLNRCKLDAAFELDEPLVVIAVRCPALLQLPAAVNEVTAFLNQLALEVERLSCRLSERCAFWEVVSPHPVLEQLVRVLLAQGSSVRCPCCRHLVEVCW
ncbi:MAG: hypothetical protein [Cressdnaviricota sp.]|nr:MAG: hypothetical protein [Cressdnaviricota sp.]